MWMLLSPWRIDIGGSKVVRRVDVVHCLHEHPPQTQLVQMSAHALMLCSWTSTPREQATPLHALVCCCPRCRMCAAEGCGATEGLRKCSGCGAVRYCSREHQVAHWAAHKAECRRLAAGKQEPATAEAAQAGAAQAGAAEVGGSTAVLTEEASAKAAPDAGAGKAGAADGGAVEERAAAEE